MTSSTSILRRTDLKLYRVDSANQPPTRTRLFLFGGADAAFSFSASLNGEEEPVDGSKAAKVIKLEKKGSLGRINFKLTARRRRPRDSEVTGGTRGGRGSHRREKRLAR